MAAGVLIGFSLVVAGFALTETTTTAWQAVLAVGAPAILVLGIALQLVVEPEPHGRS